jgi:hypothetical protein
LGGPVVTRVVRSGTGVIPTAGDLQASFCDFPRPTAGDCNFDDAINIVDPVR